MGHHQGGPLSPWTLDLSIVGSIPFLLKRISLNELIHFLKHRFINIVGSQVLQIYSNNSILSFLLFINIPQFKLT